VKRTPIPLSLLRILLCLLVIAAGFFRSHLLPLTGIANFIVSAAALVLTIISILVIYKSICSIINELDP
jgi:hypothetical protein